ncbi:unnamed protein product [Heterobilharzia americana]|nr:unnamed protein product [Heterobilharzia americana]CAH8669907.1 unnamed protein product [Heterobilharzia americana]
MTLLGEQWVPFPLFELLNQSSHSVLVVSCLSEEWVLFHVLQSFPSSQSMDRSPLSVFPPLNVIPRTEFAHHMQMRVMLLDMKYLLVYFEQFVLIVS